ncbi:MAG TPA: di-heme oxidoredictase family protein [Thermoanaerobaculia bacterium]|nr:di-heme oxidoredictase family protein [Thermoanaerobaculia bacterium]
MPAIVLLLVLGAPWLAWTGAGEAAPTVPPPTVPPAALPPAAAEPGEELSAGAATVFIDPIKAHNAFGHALGNMVPTRWHQLRDGKRFFLMNWGEPRPGTQSGDGLGPLFNAVSCSFCHFKDGRGHPPEEGGAEIPLLVRLSVPGEDGAELPEPRYGWQLQEHGAQGFRGEAKIVVQWQEIQGRYPDGEPYTLRKPRLDIRDLADGPLAPGTRMSARMPPALLGLGLLEAVPDVAILALADPGDADGDGISGRPNYVQHLRTGGKAIGRFGWKANQPTLEQQNAMALQEDIGITSELLPAHACGARQEPCRTAAGDDAQPEASGYELGRITLYTRLLAVPARRDWQDPAVLRGKALFRQAGCESCHHPRLETGAQASLPELAGQTIRPYTDLLLHDLGPELADGRPDFEAEGSEWRTAPLWGLGLVSQVTRDARLLHDGRARGPAEAILWHGGEAEPARDRFRQLPQADRAALLRFLDSL